MEAQRSNHRPSQQAGSSSTSPSSTSFVSCAPCRLCLFGEHQDYLGLPVIAMSIPLYCRIRVVQTVERSNSSILSSTDLGKEEDSPVIISLTVPEGARGSKSKITHYNLDDLPPPQRRQHPNSAGDDEANEPDFALAALHEALRDGWTFSYGATCVSSIDLPLRAGCSTSSAFCVAWIQALARLANPPRHLTPLQLARRAHQAEVTHFGAPGGTMDHITCAVGGLLRIGGGGGDPWRYVSLPTFADDEEGDLGRGGSTTMGVWVLAYSGEPKDTLRHLWRCKAARLELLQKLGGDWDRATDGGADERVDVSSSSLLSEDERELLRATRINRDTEAAAFRKWTATATTSASTAENRQDRNGSVVLGQELGALMTKHHEALRDGLQLSTPKLEALREAAVQAGAWGFKVVGSGGGGCGVAWSSLQDADNVSDAMQAAGAPLVWTILSPSVGAHILLESEHVR